MLLMIYTNIFASLLMLTFIKMDIYWWAYQWSNYYQYIPTLFIR
jgi:hypothetical protein